MGNENTTVKPGAYYVNYPEYMVMSSESSADGEDGGRLGMGHAGVLLVDNNGNTRYYEYGRYNTGIHALVKDEDGSSGGNWRRVSVSGSNLNSIGEQLLNSSGSHAGNTVRFTHIPDADYNKVLSYIDRDARDANRDHYQICGYNDRNCGSQAYAAIDAGNDTSWWRQGINGLVSGIQRLGQSLFQIPHALDPRSRGINNTQLGFGGLAALTSGRDTPQDYEDKFITYDTHTYTRNK